MEKGERHLTFVDCSPNIAPSRYMHQASVTPRDGYFHHFSGEEADAERLTELQQARSLNQWISSWAYQLSVLAQAFWFRELYCVTHTATPSN